MINIKINDCKVSSRVSLLIENNKKAEIELAYEINIAKAKHKKPYIILDSCFALLDFSTSILVFVTIYHLNPSQ